jgi:large conductance mechanosensitive channel
LVITLKKAQYADTGQLIADAVAIRYGVFLDNLIAFLIVAAALFILVKAINAMQKKEPAPAPVPPPPSKQEVLLEEIRDLLKDRCSQ